MLPVYFTSAGNAQILFRKMMAFLCWKRTLDWIYRCAKIPRFWHTSELQFNTSVSKQNGTMVLASSRSTFLFFGEFLQFRRD